MSACAHPVQRRRGAALERALQEAALAELAEVGFSALTMEGVAHRAGAGKASLYKRWASTEELVLSALAATDDTFEAERERLMASDRFELRTALVAVLSRFAEGLDTPNGAALQVLMAWGRQYPRLVARVREVMVTPRQELLRAVLERAVREGEIQASVVTPWMLATGPRLVIAQHHDTGRVVPADIEAIVDQVLLPALHRDLLPQPQEHSEENR